MAGWWKEQQPVTMAPQQKCQWRVSTFSPAHHQVSLCYIIKSPCRKTQSNSHFRDWSAFCSFNACWCDTDNGESGKAKSVLAAASSLTCQDSTAVRLPALVTSQATNTLENCFEQSSHSCLSWRVALTRGAWTFFQTWPRARLFAENERDIIYRKSRMYSRLN